MIILTVVTVTVKMVYQTLSRALFFFPPNIWAESFVAVPHNITISKTHTHKHTHTYTHTHTHADTYLHTRTHTYIHTHIYI